MKILVFEHLKEPYEKEIDGSLESMQQTVGGDIEIIYPFTDQELALVCDDEGKLKGLPAQRLLLDEDGVPYDYISGTFFVARCGEEDLVSLTDDDVKAFKTKHWKSFFVRKEK